MPRYRNFDGQWGIGWVIDPGKGDGVVVIRTDYQPWLLGFCRWSIRRYTPAGRTFYVETIKEGKWKWRGLHALCTDTQLPDHPTRAGATREGAGQGATPSRARTHVHTGEDCRAG